MTNKPMLSVKLRAGLERLLENGYAQYLTKIDVAELQALLDAPAERPARPVAFKFTRKGHRVVLSEYNSPECHFNDPKEWHCTPLYAEQPAPVAVVMPEYLDTKQMDGYQSPYDNGWNACLAAVARLNGVAP